MWGKCTYITKAVLNNHRKTEHHLGLLFQHLLWTLAVALPKGSQMLRQFPSPLNHFPAPDASGLSPLSVARAHRNTCSCARDFHQIPWNSSRRLQSFLPETCSQVAALSPTGAFSSSQERAPSPSKFHSFLFAQRCMGIQQNPLSQYSQEMIQKRR